MPKMIEEVPKAIKPYKFHGLDLTRRDDGQWQGDCPWCGKEGKFTVNQETGLWRCFVCGAGSEKGGGNLQTFLRMLWDASDKATNGQATSFAEERGLLHSETLNVWGCCVSTITNRWLVPGYGLDPVGKPRLEQLYQRFWIEGQGRWEMRPTPTLGHCLHGLPLFDKNKQTVYVHESWGNALAFWEVLRCCKDDGAGGLTATGNETASLLADANVIAVANCGAVGKDLTRFMPLLAGKDLVVMFDNDHPREHAGKTVMGAGYEASKRFAAICANAGRHVPNSLRWLRWGDAGWAADLPSGHDVRDWLKDGTTMPDRVKAMQDLLAMVHPVPDEWIGGKAHSVSKGGSVGMEPSECSSWSELIRMWDKQSGGPMQWRSVMGEVLATMLAVALSTEQRGDQLFLQVIGDAGSGKTRFCDAMLTSKTCFSLEHLTGFHSGWKDGSGETFSLLAKINGKTLITPEGDVLMSSPRFGEIMSQQRRIFDGSSTARYKNSKEDDSYSGLRTPWIIAGTPVMLDKNQASLGDRFLKVFFDSPEETERKNILNQVVNSALDEVVQSSNGTADSIIDERMRKAYCATGGYVEHLRRNSSELLAGIEVDREAVVTRCGQLAELASFLRARPGPVTPFDQGRERHDSKEEPNRLAKQFARLSVCLPAVMGFKRADELLDLVKKIALDTCRGMTLQITRLLHEAKGKGKSTHQLSLLVGMPEGKLRDLMVFLSKIGAVRIDSVKGEGHKRWFLTPKLAELAKQVL